MSTTTSQHRDVLPANVRARHYAVRLDSDLATLTFKGRSTVELEVVEPTAKVILHAVELDFSSVEASVDNEAIKVKRYEIEGETLVISLEKVLGAGARLALSFAFVGDHNDRLAGFYRTKYTAEDGSDQYYVSTQMEPADCRRAFPCIDEPAAKATFDITLVHDSNLVALSNMDVKSTKVLQAGRTETQFNRTPQMSTYLFAAAIGPFVSVEAQYPFRIPCKVWGRKGNEHKFQFSADLAAWTVEFFESKLGIEYPLPKLDLLAIDNFASGAMENWGLITFREAGLMFDEATDSSNDKKWVTETVMHEIAHQWFGNLVTMEWWDGLWLNEGFATWMSWYACDAKFPEWNVWQIFVAEVQQQALNLDALRSSHPVEMAIQRSEDIDQLFDAISYEKGSAVLGMIANLVGRDVMVASVADYLQKHKYGNTCTEDLWRAMANRSGVDIVSIMNGWTQHVGYPYLTVSEAQGSVHVRQNRFLSSGDTKPDEDQTLYAVGLDVRSGDEIKRQLMTTRDDTVKGLGPSYKFNADQAGFYRVLYPSAHFQHLVSSPSGLSVQDKIGIVSDTRALASAGLQPTSDVLALAKHWKTEKPRVVMQLLAGVSAVEGLYESDDKLRPALAKLKKEIIAAKVPTTAAEFLTASAAVSGDDLATHELNATLFSQALKLDVGDYMEWARKAYFDYRDNNNSAAFTPNQRPSVFASYTRNGGEAEWQEMLDLYKKLGASTVGNVALGACMATRDPALVQKTWNHVLDGTIEWTDSYELFRRSEPGLAVVSWQWFKDNYARISKEVPTSFIMGDMILGLVRNLSTRQHLKDVETFFANKNDIAAFDLKVSNAKNALETKVQWAERAAANVAEWLEKN